MKKIALDVDGVVADTVAVMDDFVSRKGHKLDFEQYHPKLPNVGNSKAFMRDIVHNILCEQSIIKPYEDALYFVPTIDRYLGDVTFITARKEDFNIETVKWLDRHFSIKYDLVNVSSKDKPDYIRENEFDMFVEDRLQTANRAAEAGIDTYLISRRWNVGRPTHEKVTRTGSLGGFYSIAISRVNKKMVYNMSSV